MASTHWTGKGDGVHWSNPANWSAGVPSAGIDASFGSGTSEAVDLAGPSNPLSAGSLIVQADALGLAAGVLDLSHEPAENGNTYDLVLSHGANLTVTKTARIYGSNVAEIGNGTGATLTVLGLMTEEYGIIRSGTLDVSGPNGHWVSGDSGLYFQDATFTVEGGLTWMPAASWLNILRRPWIWKATPRGR